MLKKMEERLAKLETNQNTVASVDLQKMQQQITEKVEELHHDLDPEEVRAEEVEIQRRQTSLIIHGIPESSSDTSDKRKDDDMLVVAAMLNELSASSVKVEQLIRLGKRPEAKDAKPRPLKMIVDTVDNKFKLIRNAKNLRRHEEGDWVNVYVHQDLTPKQREARSRLVTEMRERTAKGERNLTIYNGKVVKKRNY